MCHATLNKIEIASVMVYLFYRIAHRVLKQNKVAKNEPSVSTDSRKYELKVVYAMWMARSGRFTFPSAVDAKFISDCMYE